MLINFERQSGKHKSAGNQSEQASQNNAKRRAPKWPKKRSKSVWGSGSRPRGEGEAHELVFNELVFDELVFLAFYNLASLGFLGLHSLE